MGQYAGFSQEQLALFEGYGDGVIPGEGLLLAFEEFIEGMKNMFTVRNEAE